jgi:hypothetical protein
MTAAVAPPPLCFSPPPLLLLLHRGIDCCRYCLRLLSMTGSHCLCFKGVFVSPSYSACEGFYGGVRKIAAVFFLVF